MKKFGIAIFAGGVAYFLLGGVIYEILLGGFYESNLGSATGVVRDVPVFWALALSQFGLAAMVTYVFHHVGVTSAGDGVKTGAIFGLLFGFAISINLFAATNWSNMNVALVEPFVTAVRISLGGAVIGWALGEESVD